MRGMPICGALIALGALVCASAEASDSADAATNAETVAGGAEGVNVDPWEPLNRQTFKAYLFVDDNLIVPLAKGYRAVTPEKARKGLRNFLSNGTSANLLVNDLLQGEFKRAGQTLARFVINTTIGFGGAADPAERLGIPSHNEDFGQTMAVWGVPQGPFLYLPLFGPTTVRDGIGIGADLILDPVYWIKTRPARLARYSRFGASAIALREPVIEPLAEIRTESLDYYSSLRSFYLQARKREIANGETSFDDLPDIGAYDDALDPEAEAPAEENKN
jgi:phospholipid-binding lipoprotein MlaA